MSLSRDLSRKITLVQRMNSVEVYFKMHLCKRHRIVFDLKLESVSFLWSQIWLHTRMYNIIIVVAEFHLEEKRVSEIKFIMKESGYDCYP